MPQDAYTLKYLCKELNNLFQGGKINRIIEPSNDEVLFTVFTGKKTEKLYISVNPVNPRIGVIDYEMDSPLTAPNFCMLLRKHLLSASIDSIDIVGFDRIVKIELTAYSEFSNNDKKTLYIELMGRYSNIILTENGNVLGGNRGINMFDDVVRPLIVGKPYVFPPVQDKFIPCDEKLKEQFKLYNDGDFSQFLCSKVQGIASITAKEIIKEYQDKYQVDNIKDDLNNGDRFFIFLNEFLYNTKINACVIYDNNTLKDICTFPYTVISGDVKYFDSLCNAEEEYFCKKEREKKFNQKKDKITNIVNSAIKKVKKKLASILSKKKDAVSCEENKIKGDLIISNIYRIKSGESFCQLENFYDDNKLVTITLDEHLSPQKNAEVYFKRYNKQKRTLLALAPQETQANDELNYLESVLTEINNCETIEDLVYIYTELESYGLIVEQKKVKKKVDISTCREYIYKGYKIKVGRNNTENDEVTFSANGDSMWLHLKDYHSSHVIIEYNGKDFSDEIIKFASEICAYYSGGRNSDKVEICYTLRKNVKKPPKSKPGFCIYSKYCSILVKANNHIEYLQK